MPTTNKKPVLVVLAAIVLAIVVYAFCHSATHDRDAPFARCPEDFPRVILVREAPSRADQPAWEAFEQEVQALWQHRLHDGAIRNAAESEQEAVRHAWHQEYVLARKAAKQALAVDSKSVPALYAMSLVEARAESNLPYALFLVRKARHLLEDRGTADPHDSDAREWYLYSLELEREILRYMDRNKEELQAIELMEQVYQPMPWLKIWPMIKLKRFSEARQQAKQTLADGRCTWRGLNGLLALEERLHNRVESMAAGRRLVEYRGDSALSWRNYASAAYGVFRLDEVERALRKSAGMERQDFDGTSYLPLAGVYVRQARFVEAGDALREAQRQRSGRSTHTLEQDAAAMELAKAELCLAVGETNQACQFVSNGVQDPDRAGMSSADQRDNAVGDALLHWSILRTRATQLAEAAAARPSSLTPDLDYRAARLELWHLQQRLRGQLTGQYLVNVVRPALPGAPGPVAWLSGDLSQILPLGLLQEGIRQAREFDDLPQAAAYLDALEAEVQLQAGEPAAALRLAKRALANLPAKAEKLLHSRMRAVAGWAHWQQDHYQDALGHWDHVLREFPQAFRLLEISLPVRVEEDSSPAAGQLVPAMLASPRFHRHARGFRVRIRTDGGRLSFELDRSGGAKHLTHSIRLDEGNQAVIALHRAVHDKFGRPFFDLSQLDLESLNGSPAAIRHHSQVEEFLDSFSQ